MTVIHRLNCATLCVPRAPFVVEDWPCLCLLIETDGDGLVLVDTGLGVRECRTPRQLPTAFRRLFNPVLSIEETAVERVRALGHDPRDVQHIVVTHLDVDHAGGLADFPWARVHVHAAEYAAATMRPGLYEKMRYQRHQWAHRPHWETYADAGDDWFGFEAVRPIRIGSADIALVPLTGHTRGHSGVAVQDRDGWLLHVGDAVFRNEWIHGRDPDLLTDLFQRINCFDNGARRENIRRLGALVADHADDVEVICSHDPGGLPAVPEVSS